MVNERCEQYKINYTDLSRAQKLIITQAFPTYDFSGLWIPDIYKLNSVKAVIISDSVLIMLIVFVLTLLIHNFVKYCILKRRFKSLYIATFYFFSFLLILTDISLCVSHLMAS